MANYDEATRAKMQSNFAALNPTEASGGVTTRLTAQGQSSRPDSGGQKPPSFWEGLASSAQDFGAAAPGLLKKIAKTVFIDPYKVTAKGINTAITGEDRAQALALQSKQNSELAATYFKTYRMGKITKKELDDSLASLDTQNQELIKDNDQLLTDTNAESSRDFVVNAYASVLTPLTMVGAAPASAVGNSGRLVTGATQVTAATTKAARVAAYLNKANATLEAVASKIPTLSKALNTTPEATSLAKTAFNVLVKNPIKLNLAVRDPIDVMYQASQGNYGRAAVGAAFIGLMPFEGGPLGLASKLFEKTKSGIALRAFGKTGFIDEMGKYMKSSPVEYLDNLKTGDPKKYKEALQAWKTFEAYNLQHFDGDTKAAVENIAEWHAKHSNPIGNYTPDELTDYWIDFKNSLAKAQDLAKTGKLEIDGVKISAEDASRIGLGKFGTEEKYALIKELKKLGTDAERQAVVNAMVADGYGWAQSPTMRSAIEDAVSGPDYAKKILKIATGKGVSVKGAAQEFPRNYFPIYLSKNAKGYDTEVLENIDKITTSTELGDVLERSVAPKGIAGIAGGFMQKLGLSPKDQNAQGYLAIRRNIAHNLIDGGIDFDAATRGKLTNADYIMNKLGEFAEKKNSVFDLRQLRVSEIQDALKVTSREAKTIKNAISQAYLQVPLQVRGLGDKVVDFNMKNNPFAAQYSRLQGQFRYAQNPFFYAQEVIETETLAQAVVGGKKLQLPGVNFVRNLLFKGSRDATDDVVKQLDNRGFFANAAGRGEFAQEAVTGGITSHLRPAQKITIAGFVEKLAQKQGMSVEAYLDNHADEAAELARGLVQYPKKSMLNSPLAKTLSLIAFPARYNLKVAGIAAKALAQQDPVTQVVVMNGLLRMGDWLNSDEGIAWQSRHAEAVGLMKYFTPINTLSQISKILTGSAESASDYGSLGGLPFGVIGQILDHQGIINMNTPYVNPRTGDVLPEYVPKTAKARVKTAMDDLLSSVFSYPGRTVGGPSKGEVVDTFTSKLPGVGVSRYDKDQYDKVDRSGELSAKSLHRQEVIRAQNGVTPGKGTVPNPFQEYAIPPPTTIKPLVIRKRLPRKSPQASSTPVATGPKPKKKYTARAPQL